MNEPAVIEEYVILDLGNAAAIKRSLVDGPFSLTGLNTSNPTLRLANGIKLGGDYEETVGTTLLFEKAENELDSAGPRLGTADFAVKDQEEEDKLEKVQYFGKANVRLRFRPT